MMMTLRVTIFRVMGGCHIHTGRSRRAGCMITEEGGDWVRRFYLGQKMRCYVMIA